MAKLRILQYPDPRLKRIAKPVDKVDDNIRRMVDEMFELHYNSENCAALAATQLSFEDPPAITVIDFSPNKDQPLCLINPEIIEQSGEQNEFEGCMSVLPEYIHEKVTRPQKIKVRALDRDGKPLEFEAEGFMAKCIQHEIDHLYGKVYIDRLSKLKRMRVDQKIHKAQQTLKKKKQT